MEYLLHYVWQHRLLPARLFTPQGEEVEVIDPGLHNFNAGPDFFNAKIKINGELWAGNVEIHTASHEWFEHGHEKNPAYNNVILHVATQLDCEVATQNGRQPPQVQVTVPKGLQANYDELVAEEAYPTCYRVIPSIPAFTIHAWMNRLTVERLEEKMARIGHHLERTNGDWAHAFFVTLARNFGFGINAEAFEAWALSISLQQAGKHRDNPFQVEAFFLGQAGLLDTHLVPSERQDAYFAALEKEYRFLQSKFGLRPIDPRLWRFMRLRPQNFPHVRLSQLARLYCKGCADLSRVLETHDLAALRELFATEATEYWQTHYAFGQESAPARKQLQAGSLNLILVNTVAPILFAYGRHHFNEDTCERAFRTLELVPPERNFVTRSWERAGIRAEHAADSQALIQLRRNYCDKKDCLRCRFGTEYLRKP